MKKPKGVEVFSLEIDRFWKKTLHFTERLLILLTLFYFINWSVSVILIWFAIQSTGNFSYLDTLITETSVTFRDIVGIGILKALFENIAKYNDFGGRMKSRPVPPDEGTFVVKEVVEEATAPADEAGAAG